MRRLVCQNRRTLVGVALVVASLFVTSVGGWGQVRSALGVVAAILAVLLVLKTVTIVLSIGTRLLR